MSQVGNMCIVCGTPAALMCQRCGEPYCNDVCQRKDWQKHKYVCTIMPSLVALKVQKPLAAARLETVAAPAASRPTVEPSSGLDLKSSTLGLAQAADSGKIKLSSEWKQFVMPPEKEFFECRVTCMQRDGSFWVVDGANTERLERLTDNMARSMKEQQPYHFQELTVGELVGVIVDNKAFRGELLSLDGPTETAEVRLIDYGAVKTIDVMHIYAPVQRMAGIKAYAFQVKLPTNTGVQINKNLTLRLLGTQTADGIEQVQLKPKMTIPLNLPVQMLATNPAVAVAKILQHDAALNEPHVALLQIKVMSNLNDDLNTHMGSKPKPFTAPFPDEIRTFFLAASTKQGFRRALLLDFTEQPQLFLVYEMDEGRISLTSEVRRIPSELLGHSMRVFAATLKDCDALQKLAQSEGDVCIKFLSESLSAGDNDKLRTANATLLVNNKEQLCPVRVDTFLGRVGDLGHKFWREPIENGDMVYITHVVNYKEICISSVETKQYDEIFNNLESKCLPFCPSSNIALGSVVLVVTPGQVNYRAEVTGEHNNKLTVYNIDTGSTQNVSPKCLRMACRFVENLPVSLRRVQINTICNLPSSAVPANTVALQLLMKCFTQKTEMQVQFSDKDCSIADLLDLSADPQSLMTRMLPMMFTPAAVELEPALNLPPIAIDVGAPEPIEKKPQMAQVTVSTLPPLPPSPPVSPTPVKKINRYYFNDLERQLIPQGENMQILILNSIDLHKTGFVTACYFANEKLAENFQNLLNVVGKVGALDDSLPTGYLPDVGEMCLTLFTEDNSWYRGVCQRVTGQHAFILYCDFGNSEMVPMDRIKPISTKLLHGVYATKCFIDGFDVNKIS